MTRAVTWEERPAPACELPLVDLASLAARRGLRPTADAGAGAVAVLVARSALETVFRHGRASPLEQGGILLGRAYRLAEAGPGGPRFLVDIVRALGAGDAASTAISFRFGPETWSGLRRRWAALAPDLEIVGWFHTHPNLGAFFSGTDRATQRDFFTRPWQVGLVVDPVRGEEAWFAGASSERLRARTCYDDALAGDIADSGLVLRPAVARAVGILGEIRLADGSVVRVAGIALPPRSARSKPIRRLERRARRALVRALGAGRCEIGPPLAAPGGGPAAVHVIASGVLVAERLIGRGLARLVASEAGPFEARLDEAERTARWCGQEIWRKKTRDALDAIEAHARLAAARTA